MDRCGVYNVGFIGGGAGMAPAGTERRRTLFVISDVVQSASTLTNEQLVKKLDDLISARDNTQREFFEQDRQARELGWKIDRDGQNEIFLEEINGNRSYRF